MSILIIILLPLITTGQSAPPKLVGICACMTNYMVFFNKETGIPYCKADKKQDEPCLPELNGQNIWGPEFDTNGTGNIAKVRVLENDHKLQNRKSFSTIKQIKERGFELINGNKTKQIVQRPEDLPRKEEGNTNITHRRNEDKIQNNRLRYRIWEPSRRSSYESSTTRDFIHSMLT